VPFLFGLWGLIAALTYARDTADAGLGLYFSLTLVGVSLGVFGLFAFASYLSPGWLKRYKLQLYENGFVKQDFFRARRCLWDEIKEVKAVLLVYDAASRNTPPSEFGKIGEDTKDRGVYEVYKRDGSKMNVSRRYSDVEQIDKRLVPFCKEAPQW
jgi:hypothetical protein